MSTDLYIVIILIIFFVAMFLTMIFLIHFKNVSIFLISGFISFIVVLIAITPVMVFDAFFHTQLTSQISVQKLFNKYSRRHLL